MPTKPNHTPSPWRFTDAGPNSGNIVRGELLGANGEHIADIITESDEPLDVPLKQWIPNARLLAAAPELLEAVSELIGMGETLEMEDEAVTGVFAQKCKRTLDYARSVFAQATQV